jgi:PAS domain S-box-containing protein
MKLKEIPIGVFIIKKDRIEYGNRSFCKIVGYKEEEIKGMKIHNLIPPEEMERFNEISDMLKKKQTFVSEFPLLHKDGKRRINVNITKDLALYGRDKICIGTVQETDLIENVVDEILSFLGQFYSFFEESEETMYITSPEGKLLEINPAGVKLFGYESKENFLKANVTNHYVNKKDRIDFQKDLEKAGSVKDYELTLKAKNGRLMNVLVTANVIKDEEGKTLAYRGTIRDVTEPKKIEETLREFQKMEALGRLAQGITHDFNNLLTVILGNTEILLRMTKPGDPSYERLRLIFEASEKASSLTNQLLTFSKSKSISSINFNPNTLINKVGIFLSRILGEKIKLNLLLNPDVACINASPDQIEQVILNLAINSRDAMPEGGSLTISTENVEFKESEIKLKPWVKPGKYVLIKVSDTGKGIPEEIIDRIFEPFFSTKEKGSGLGLSIVYGIVRQSGGHINVESKLGEGTTFRIFIPASEEKTDYLIKPESREKMFKKRGARILVIEDDPNVLEFIKDVLESSGYEVVTASTGEEGIEIAREERELDLLITDMVLPKINGLETAKEILKYSPKTKVIFISGYPSNKINEIFGSKNFVFLQKPFTPSTLLEKIDDLLTLI